MSIKHLLSPTNRRVRILVGLLLAGLFTVQCTRTEAFRESSFVTALGGKVFGGPSSEAASRIEDLARTDHIALIEHCLSTYPSLYSDFTATFIKQERINGVVGAEQWIDVKFLDDPFSVAMKWTKNAPIGEQVIYVEGKHNNKMLVKPRGMLAKMVGTVLRDPDSAEAMRNTLRPVNCFGFKRTMLSLLDVYKDAAANGDLKQSFGGYADVAGRRALVLIRDLPARKDYPAARSITYIDSQTLVPVCIEGYNWQDELICRYVYKDIKFNAGLNPADFLPEANGMSPPK